VARTTASPARVASTSARRVPVPTAEQFADGIAVLSQKNEKVKGFDIARYIDASYLQNAVARGLDKVQ